MSLPVTPLQESPQGPTRGRLDAVRDGESVVVRRRSGLFALVGVCAAVLAALFLWRAVDGGDDLSWLVGAVLVMLAGYHLGQWLDARVPMLVADRVGIRIRVAEEWHGLLWSQVDSVVVRGPKGWWSDGYVGFGAADDPADEEGPAEGPAEGAAGERPRGKAARRLRANTRRYGVPFVTAIGMTTVSSHPDLERALRALADGRPLPAVTPPATAPVRELPREEDAGVAAGPADGRDTEPEAWPAGPGDRETPALRISIHGVDGREAGDCESGDYEVGDYETGDHESGDHEAGDRQAGDREPGPGAEPDYAAGPRTSGAPAVVHPAPGDQSLEAASLEAGSPEAGSPEAGTTGDEPDDDRSLADPQHPSLQDPSLQDPSRPDQDTVDHAHAESRPVVALRLVRRALRADVIRRAQRRAEQDTAGDGVGPQADTELEPSAEQDRQRRRVRGNMSLVLDEPIDTGRRETAGMLDADGATTREPVTGGAVADRSDSASDTGRAPAETTPPAAPEPTVGADLAAARRAMDQTVDDLSARTRIRAHVIEAIEEDDFGPCGGDFYARGHLRTLCSALGVDPEPVLQRYERDHAREPVDARTVFEAELGSAGAIRGVGRGPNWAALVTAVLVVVLLWAVVTYFTDGAALGASPY